MVEWRGGYCTRENEVDQTMCGVACRIESGVLYKDARDEGVGAGGDCRERGGGEKLGVRWEGRESGILRER